MTKILFPFFLVISSVAVAGGVVGNGGDSVFCKASSENSLNGTYSLDYVLGLWQLDAKPGFLAQDIFATPESQTNNFKRLIPILEETYPAIADSMRKFYSQLFLQDFSQDAFWKPTSHGLIDLQDEKMISLLPKNCLGSEANPSLIQTVIREERGQQIIYNYDSNAIKALSEQPMQLSFLLFHEWLWNLTDDVSLIRDANLVFHAGDWSLKSVDQQVKTLSKMGLFKFLLERTARTKFIFENGNLRVFYQDQEIMPVGQDFQVKVNPNEFSAIYQFLSSDDFYLGLYEYYDENGGNLRPKFAFAKGEEKKEVTVDQRARTYTVVLTKRLSLDPPQVFHLNYISE
jgi:hypothetical protein